MTFAKRLAEERAAAGLTSTALAARAGVDRTTVWRYEHGNIEAATSSAQALADALGLSIEDLYLPPMFVDVFLDRPAAAVAKMASAGRRVAAWPQAAATYRARLLALPEILDACQSAGIASRVAALEPASSLTVLVDAPTQKRAVARVLGDTVPLGSCPPVSASRHGDLWLARLRCVPAECSVRLQARIPTGTPTGMYTPAR